MRKRDETAHADRGDLAPDRAFVVQVRRRRGALAGRVEHMTSGEAAHFASADELLAFLTGRSRLGGREQAPPDANAKRGERR